MHKRLISILLITEKWQRINQQQMHGTAYYISYSLSLIFLTVKNYCDNIKEKTGLTEYNQQVENHIFWEEKRTDKKKTPC